MLTKRELRTQIRKIGALFRQERCTDFQKACTDWSESVCRSVLNTSQWQNAATVMLYNALPDEVDLQLLLRQAWQAGKRVLLPVVKGDGEMVVRLVEASTPFQCGAYGIQEPVGDDFTDYGQIDLIVVPGMAFDAEGHRLGRGKGYYDRFLPQAGNAYKLGVCFPFQFVDAVPVDPHDQRMDSVVCQ